MEANELRIGNIIKCKCGKDNWGEIRVNRDIMFYFGSYKASASPITNKWLLESGFDNNSCIAIDLDTSAKILQVTHEGDVLIYDEDGDFICLKSVKYKHQIQNLYFALTGKELKLVDNG